MSKRRESVTQQVIKAVSAGPVAALLVPDGFKRQAPHFWRETDGLFHSVNFQASQWGTSEDGQFTVNLGVSSPSLYSSFTGRSFPKNPGTVFWPIYNRIGGLMPSRCDLWWRVTDQTDPGALGLEVANTLHDYALPFFESIRTAEQFNELLLGNQPIPGVTAGQRPLIGATVAVQLGQLDEARRLLCAALNENRGKPFESTVRNVARELRLELDGA
jgi:hypothetical protein